MDAMNMRTKFEVVSFTCSWDNRGYPQQIGQSLDTPALPFSKIFNGLLFGWTQCHRATDWQTHRQTNGCRLL